MHSELHDERQKNSSPQEKPVVLAFPGIPVIFFLPRSRLSVPEYAQMTGQTVRAVRQQLNRGRLPRSESASRERQINMLSLFLQDYADAVTQIEKKTDNQFSEG